jgi:hypothetical protein
MIMKYSFVFILSFLVAGSACAYNPSVNEPSVPYEVFHIETNIEEQSEYLGNLRGDPHMYEFSVDETAELSLSLVQLYQESIIPLSLIVIKVNNDDKGVTEIGRLHNSDIEWQTYGDGALGLKLKKSDSFEAELSLGTYRVEVSTPDNIGDYMLIFGNDSDSVSAGYFETLSQVRMIQSFFGSSVFGMLQSTYIRYPLGIVILFGLIYMTWRGRHNLQGR